MRNCNDIHHRIPPRLIVARRIPRLLDWNIRHVLSNGSLLCSEILSHPSSAHSSNRSCWTSERRSTINGDSPVIESSTWTTLSSRQFQGGPNLHKDHYGRVVRMASPSMDPTVVMMMDATDPAANHTNNHRLHYAFVAAWPTIAFALVHFIFLSSSFFFIEKYFYSSSLFRFFHHHY